MCVPSVSPSPFFHSPNQSKVPKVAMAALLLKLIRHIYAFANLYSSDTCTGTSIDTLIQDLYS